MNNQLLSAVESLKQDYIAIANPPYGLKMTAYMKGKFPFYGVRAPMQKVIEKKHKLLWKSMTKKEMKSYTKALWEAPQRELQYTALSALRYKVKQLTPEDLPFIEHLILSKSWWDTVDSLAPNLAGMIFLKHPDIKIEWIDRWNNHEDMWLKRSAIIHQLRYSTRVDLDLLFALVEANKGSSEFFINKACGWALRQASKKYPAPVKEFIKMHQDLSNLTKKEGSKYL